MAARLQVQRRRWSTSGDGEGVGRWVLRSGGILASVQADFANGGYWRQGVSNPRVDFTGIGGVCTRASTGYAVDGAGLWTLFPANVARITNRGLLVEG